MATIKLGPIVSAIRGSVAGVTFSANKAGPYARGWSKGANPSSTLQSDQRGLLGALAAAWRDLSQADRDDWIVYAALPAQDRTNSLGETFSASGFNWFVKINLQLEAADEVGRDDPPTLTRPVAPIIQIAWFRVTGSAFPSAIRLDVTSPNLAFNHVVFAWVVSSQGRTTASLKFAFMQIAVPNPSRDVDFQDELETAFGTLALGQRAFFTVATQDSHGQRAPIDSFTGDALA